MPYITASDLENFIGKFPKDGDTLPQTYVDGALEKVRKYLGYDPEGATRTEKLRGDDGYYLTLKAMPVIEITGFKINGVSHDPSLLQVVDEDRSYIEYADGISMFSSGEVYEITYKAGWFPLVTEHYVYSSDGEHFFEDEDMTIEAVIPEGVIPVPENETDRYKWTTSVPTVPALIRTVALQIGSLLWESAGGNLAVSSTSFSDTGTRVFNNYQADRYLDAISEYKRPL